MRFVVDASLATKWLTDEPDSDQARAFLVRYSGQLDAPDVLLTEVGQSIVRRTNLFLQTQEDAERGFAGLVKVVSRSMTLHRVTPALTVSGGRLAVRLRHPIKDCIYLALADQLGCPLVTCDDRFRVRVGDAGRVRSLSEMV